MVGTSLVVSKTFLKIRTESLNAGDVELLAKKLQKMRECYTIIREKIITIIIIIINSTNKFNY